MKENSLIAIIGAMAEEISACLAEAENIREENWNGTIFYRAEFCQREVVIVQSGIGKVLAAMTCQRLIDVYKPKEIIFTGVAGALNPQYDIGDVVVARDLMQHDIDGRALGFKRGTILFSDKSLFTTNKALSDKALATPLHEHKVYQGRVLTGDQFMNRDDILAHAYLTEDMQGDAIEMEGAAIAQVCDHNAVACVIIRTISDKADGQAAEDFSKLLPLVAGNSMTMLKHLLS